MKAVSLFKFTKDSEFKIKEMLQEDVLAQHKFSPCGDLDKRKIGFVKNVTSGTFVDEIHVEGNSFHVVTIREQKKTPEKYLIEQEVDVKKVLFSSDSEGQEPSKQLLKEWKEEATLKVLEITPPKKPVDFVIAIRNDGVVFVEAKPKQAENLLALLRKAIGSLPVVPLETEIPVTDLLDTLVEKNVSDILTLGDKVELIDGESIKHTLTKGSVYNSDASDYVAKEGMNVMSLALEYDGVVSFKLTDELVFDGIKFSKDLFETIGDEGEKKDVSEATSFILKLDELNKTVNNVLGRLVDKEGK